MVFHDFTILQIVICNNNNYKLKIAGDFSWLFPKYLIKTVKYEFRVQSSSAFLHFFFYVFTSTSEETHVCSLFLSKSENYFITIYSYHQELIIHLLSFLFLHFGDGWQICWGKDKLITCRGYTWENYSLILWHQCYIIAKHNLWNQDATKINSLLYYMTKNCKMLYLLLHIVTYRILTNNLLPGFNVPLKWRNWIKIWVGAFSRLLDIYIDVNWNKNSMTAILHFLQMILIWAWI